MPHTGSRSAVTVETDFGIPSVTKPEERGLSMYCWGFDFLQTMGAAEIKFSAFVFVDVLRGCGVHVHPADGVSLNNGGGFGCAHLVRGCAGWLASYAVRYPMLYIGFIRRNSAGSSISYRRALANDLSRRGFQLRCAAGRARAAGDRQHAGGLR